MTKIRDVNMKDLKHLVRKLQEVEYDSEDALDADVQRLEEMVAHPAPAQLIFHWDEYFNSRPTPGQIVDRILAYKPIDLSIVSSW